MENWTRLWCVAAALAAALGTYPPIRSAINGAVDSMQANSLRIQLCVDLRAVGESLPGTNCEPQPMDNPLYTTPF